MKSPITVLLALAAVSLCACGPGADGREAAEVAGGAPGDASFQEIMLGEIDASADRLWEATGVVVDATGEHELGPKTEQDWKDLRAAVVTLIAAPDRLTEAGRPLVKPGRRIQDEGAESVATPDEIRHAFVAQRPLLLERAAAFKAVAGEALDAVDRRDLAAIEAVGERLDAACEACHESFWYPPTKTP